MATIWLIFQYVIFWINVTGYREIRNFQKFAHNPVLFILLSNAYRG